MKAILSALVAVLAEVALSADIRWVGPQSGSWNDAENWSGGVVPNGDDVKVIVDKTEPVEISVTKSVRVNAIEFSGANHYLKYGQGEFYFHETESSVPYIHVAEGCTATVERIKPHVHYATNIRKTGLGTLLSKTHCFGTKASDKYTFNDIEIVEGEFQINCNSDSLGAKRLVIKGGAKAIMVDSNKIFNETIIHVEKDGIFDMNSKRDTIGGFTGEGKVVNLGSSVTSMTCGPLEFSGEIYGYIRIGPFGFNTVQGEDGGYFKVGSANALKNATVLLDCFDTNKNGVVLGSYTNILRFAAGIGDFYIGTLKFEDTIGSAVVLQDDEGNPIQLHAGLDSGAPNVRFAGCGGFTKTIGSYTITNDAYHATGTMVVGPGGVFAGNGAEGCDASELDQVSKIEVPAGATFTMKNFDDTVWGEKPCITGAGSVDFAGSGDWTVGNLSLNGGILTVSGDGLTSTLTLAGGFSTNFQYSVPDNFTTYITGGEYHFPMHRGAKLDLSGDRKVVQTGGKVYCTLQALGKDCKNDIFWTISGGYLRSYTDPEIYQYPQGVGLDISGDAVVELRGPSSWAHRLSSGGVSHTIRIKDNAYLGVDALALGEAGCDATGTIELNGGVMDVAEWIAPLGKLEAGSPLYANILFNGGLLRSSSINDVKWCNVEDLGQVVGKVKKGGAKIDVPRANAGYGLTLTWPIVADVAAGETDGGLVKSGYGHLTLKKSCDITGPISVKAGRLISNASGDNDVAFGSGSVDLSGSELFIWANNTVRSICSGQNAKFTYGGGSALAISTGIQLSVGNADETDCPFVRNGHGVLAIDACTNDKRFGDNGVGSVKVNGTIALDTKTKLPKAPIFERLSLTGAKKQRYAFLTLDDDNKLVAKKAEVFDPASSTASTVAEISANATTVSVDTVVGALAVSYAKGKGGLVIESGKTLSIGSGEEGAVAPLVLNSTLDTDAGYASVEGGNIDFGNAEGVILLNYLHSLNTYSRITSVIKGTSGLTIAAPQPKGETKIAGFVYLEAENTYSGGTWIENASVAVIKGTSLGSGTVHVSGNEADGGSLIIQPNFNSDKFNNNLVLSGRGPAANYHHGFMRLVNSALNIRRNVKFTGTIELAGDTTVGVSGVCQGSKVAEFSGVVSGVGALKVKGGGTLKLSNANTYTGGTVIEDGVVEITDASSLGTGDVEICEGATLRILNLQAIRLANKIIGKGRIECNGEAVEFENADAFEGAKAGVGSVASDGDFVKTDSGEVWVTETLSFSGDTVVKAGTLRLGKFYPTSVPAADGVAFRLDASAEQTMLREADGDQSRVLEWADADGRGIVFTNIVDKAPVFRENQLGDKPTVFFDGTALRRLISNTADAPIQALAMVTRIKDGSHPKSWSNVGVIGFLNQDHGFRLLDRNYLKADSMFIDGTVWVDGISDMSPYTTFDFSRMFRGVDYSFEIIEAESPVVHSNYQLAIGDYMGGNYVRSYYGDIAEIVVYNRALEDDERKSLEYYLANKWGLATTVNTYTNVLPTTTSLTIDTGATVDLAGGNQSIASLSGAGTITNTSAHRAVLKLTEGESVFGGTLEGDIYLELGENAVLDLCGNTICVSAVGGSGAIVNGTVIVTDRILPGGEDAVGTLTFASAPVVAGATLEIEADGEDCDSIVVGGDFDIDGLAVRQPTYAGFTGHDYIVISTSGTLSGEFSSHNLKSRYWKLEYKESSAHIQHSRALTILVR